jgi:hypothetical protein
VSTEPRTLLALLGSSITGDRPTFAGHPFQQTYVYESDKVKFDSFFSGRFGALLKRKSSTDTLDKRLMCLDWEVDRSIWKSSRRSASTLLGHYVEDKDGREMLMLTMMETKGPKRAPLLLTLPENGPELEFRLAHKCLSLSLIFRRDQVTAI